MELLRWSEDSCCAMLLENNLSLWRKHFETKTWNVNVRKMKRLMIHPACALLQFIMVETTEWAEFTFDSILYNVFL